MKKLVLLLISVFTIVAAGFAQGGYDRRGSNDRYESSYYKDGPGYSYHNNDRRNDRYERERQAEWDRVNRDYDYRIRQYRNDNRMSRYERERRIRELERERQQKASAFGKGAIVGGIAGLLLGVLASGR